jgi:hypothetical protein
VNHAISSLARSGALPQFPQVKSKPNLSEF